MKFTPKRGLFRLALATVVVLGCLPIAEEFVLGLMCILFCLGWLIFWIAGGFFDMKNL